MEFLAALAGTIHILKKGADKYTRYFVYFLWLTFIVDIIGAYPSIAYHSKYEYFEFICNTKIESNYWWFNNFLIISYWFYITYFRWQLKNASHIKIINTLLVCFLLSSALNLAFSGVYFTQYSVFTNFSGVAVLLLSVGLFYSELLRSDRILKFNVLLPFYVSVGVVIFYMCLIPILIFNKYYKFDISQEFVDLHRTILRAANVFMYGVFILGFILCPRKKSS